MKLAWLQDIYKVWRESNPKINYKYVTDYLKDILKDKLLLYEFFSNDHYIEDINDYILYNNSDTVEKIPVLYLLCLTNDINLISYVLDKYNDIDINNTRKLVPHKYNQDEKYIDNILIYICKQHNIKLLIYLINKFKNELYTEIIIELAFYILNEHDNSIDITNKKLILILLLECQNMNVTNKLYVCDSSLVISVISSKFIPDDLKMSYYTHNTFNIQYISIYGYKYTPPDDYVMMLLRDGYDRKELLRLYILRSNKLLIQCIRETGWYDIFEVIIKERRYDKIRTYKREVRRMIWVRNCLKKNICRDIEMLVYNYI
jgi:hypothetical protein